MSTHNDKGKWLETGIKTVCAVYERKNQLRLRKVDPPVRMVGNCFGGSGRVIPMPNPFVDFVGCWPERAGRAVFLEAKATTEPRLALFKDNGLKAHQWENLTQWRAAGAAVGVIWGHTLTGQVRFLSYEAIEARARNEDKSIKWEHAEIVQAGLGFVTADFLQNLRDWHP